VDVFDSDLASGYIKDAEGRAAYVSKAVCSLSKKDSTLFRGERNTLSGWKLNSANCAWPREGCTDREGVRVVRMHKVN